MKLTKPVSESAAAPSAERASDLFKLLFQQHASGLYRLAYAHLHSRAEAQEIVQNCFLKFWEKRHEVGTDPASSKGYLYTCAYHAILNQVRRQCKWVYQDYPAELAGEVAPQLAALECQELSQHYTCALTQLPPKRREIFTLSRQQGLSNARIARQLNISIKTVEAQLTHALKFLRHYLLLRGVLPTLLLLLRAYLGLTDQSV